MIRERPSILVVGSAQDGGYPQIGCRAACCVRVRQKAENRRLPASLALVLENSFYMIDCTPAFGEQLLHIEEVTGFTIDNCAGIFLTHAHFGHYSGLPLLGLEVMHRNGMPVYIMPEMERFLKNNAPFSQLISLGNIQLLTLKSNIPVPICTVNITPIPVQHRNEFSETVGFSIKGKENSILYIPDIDSWEGIDICQLIKEHEFAFLDGTFYNRKELKNRKASKIPHPTIRESMNIFAGLNSAEKRKVHFTHLNHTNPLLDEKSEAYNHFSNSGFNLIFDGLLIHI